MSQVETSIINRVSIREEDDFFSRPIDEEDPIVRKRSEVSYRLLEHTWARKLDKENLGSALERVDDKRIEDEEGKALRNHRANRTAEEAVRREGRRRKKGNADKSDEN